MKYVCLNSNNEVLYTKLLVRVFNFLILHLAKELNFLKKEIFPRR